MPKEVEVPLVFIALRKHSVVVYHAHLTDSTIKELGGRCENNSEVFEGA